MDRIDPKQLARVREFETFIRNEGGLTGTFTDDESLRRNIDVLLEQLARDQDKYLLAKPTNEGLETRRVEASPKKDVSDSVPAQREDAEDTDDSLGLLDVMERSNEVVAELGAEMEDFAKFVGELGDIAITATADLQEVAQFGNPPASEVRTIVDRVTNEFTEHATRVEERSPRITSLMSEFTTLIDVQTRLFDDFEIDSELARTRFDQLIELYHSTQLARQNTQEMIRAVSTLPRMSVGFNVARQRIVRAYEPFLRELENSTRAIERAMAAMRKAVPALDAPLPEGSTPPRRRPINRAQSKQGRRRRNPKKQR